MALEDHIQAVFEAVDSLERAMLIQPVCKATAIVGHMNNTALEAVDKEDSKPTRAHYYTTMTGQDDAYLALRPPSRGCSFSLSSSY